MTMPDERTRAVLAAKDFLLDILTRRYKRVPKEVRAQAYRVLRHFPWTTDMMRTCKKFPEVWEWPEERLAQNVTTKLLAQPQKRKTK